MMNLVPLKAQPLNEYVVIAENKEEPRLSRLRRLRGRVKRLFWTYMENCRELAELPRTAVYNGNPLRRLRMRCSQAYRGAKKSAVHPVSVFNKTDCEALLHCYDGPTNARDALLERIRELQPGRLRWRCQYCCGSGRASLWDHYVPKGGFPEFSVCPANLVPSCFDCNLRKGERWIRAGKRAIVNLYYDRINPRWRLIEAQFAIGGDGDPEVAFSLARCHAAKTRFGRIFARHWEILGLRDRLRDDAESKFDAIRVDIRTWASHGRASVEDLQEDLASKAEGLGQSYGANNIEAVLYRAAAASRELIEHYLKGALR